MESDNTPDQQEQEALERDRATNRAKSNGTWDAVADHAALESQVNQPQGDWS